jgi:hypothetical protein
MQMAEDEVRYWVLLKTVMGIRVAQKKESSYYRSNYQHFEEAPTKWNGSFATLRCLICSATGLYLFEKIDQSMKNYKELIDCKKLETLISSSEYSFSRKSCPVQIN